MTQRDEGGPAFPSNASDAWGGPQDGMSLRDWFAGQALAGMLAHGPHPDMSHLTEAQFLAHVAGGAYSLADAMLEARK